MLPAGQRLSFATTIYNLHICCVGELVRELPAAWVDLTVEIGRIVGLRHCGVDLRVPLDAQGRADLDQPVERATVLEVNASPAVGQIANLGGRARAEAAERKLVERMLDAGGSR